MKWYHACGMGLISCLLVSNIVAGKLIHIGPLLTSASIIVFPVSYIFSDVMTEVYGFRAAGRMIWTGIACLIISTILIAVAVVIPAAASGIDQRAFKAVLGTTPRVVAASLTAFLVGSFLSAMVMSKLKVKTEGRGLSYRFVLSTVVGEGIDSLIFYSIAFYGILSWPEVLWAVMSAASIKSIYEVVVLPITTRVMKWLKREEGVDTFDYGISYNPFKQMP